MFWVHTDLIGRLPWPLEMVLNSPQAHRMHHRPPGNCNYAGVLIIWDRLFGTYMAETTRRDHFGLSAQPMTFDPIALNVAHVRRLRASGFSWGRILFGRRVPARWVCNPRWLFRPVRPETADERPGGPARDKWSGAVGRPQLSAPAAAWVVVVWAGTLTCSFHFLLTFRTMAVARAVAAAGSAVAALCCVGRACDRGDARRSALLLSGPLLAVVAALNFGMA